MATSSSAAAALPEQLLATSKEAFAESLRGLAPEKLQQLQGRLKQMAELVVAAQQEAQRLAAAPAASEEPTKEPSLRLMGSSVRSMRKGHTKVKTLTLRAALGEVKVPIFFEVRQSDVLSIDTIWNAFRLVDRSGGLEAMVWPKPPYSVNEEGEQTNMEAPAPQALEAFKAKCGLSADPQPPAEWLAVCMLELMRIGAEKHSTELCDLDIMAEELAEHIMCTLGYEKPIEG